MIEGFISPQALALLFIFFGLTIAVIIRNLRNAYSWIPYTPTLFLISVGLGYTCEHTGIIGQSIKQISKIDPRGILLIFLPPLIFESSFNSDWYIFRKQSVQIFILAFPAVLVSALLIMVSVKLVIGYDDTYYTYPQAFMFGSVLSCTDTVAVLALLKQAGAPRKFNSLIQGQSLFNDGTCMVLYTISLQLVKGKSLPPLQMIQLFLQLTVGAIILGIIFGFLSSKLISKVRNDAILTLNITVVSCYIIYFVAQYVQLGIQISGIMSLVSLGIYMAAFGKTNIAPHATQFVQHFWHFYVFVAETIIFILGGAIVGTQALNPQFIQMMSYSHLHKLLILYICMTCARFLSITIFMPKLQKQGYGLKWKQVGALTYGGLRGAVGIAFTLILASNPALRPKFQMISLLNTSGCAFLTLMINAPTCSFVIKKLGLCVKSDTKIRFFRKFMKQCEYQLSKHIQEMKKNKHLQSSNWQKVRQNAGLQQLAIYIQNCSQTLKVRGQSIVNTKQKQMRQIKQIKQLRQSKQSKQLNVLTQSLISPSKQNIHGINNTTIFSINQQLDPSLMQQIRNRYCVALKGILWQKFQSNQCSAESIRILIQCVNIDMDTIQQPLNSWDYLISHVHNPYFFPICYWLKNKPIIGSIVFTYIFDRIKLLYDVISTYLNALQQCEKACELLPYDIYLQQKVIKQSSENRSFAKKFLQDEIKKSYLQIMKRIQTTKAAQSILSYGKQFLHNTHQYGQIQDQFYKQMLKIIQDTSQKLDNDTENKQQMKDIDILKQSQFFIQLSDQQLKKLLINKIDLLVQKDQQILKSYERQKYIYLIVRGQIKQQYKIQNEVIYSRKLGMTKISGIGILMINRKSIQYSACAQSIVTLFCFPINQIKQLIIKKYKLQQILQNDIFMLQIKVQPQIIKQLQFTQYEYKKHRNHITYKRLQKGQTYNIDYIYLILLYGRLLINDNIYTQGCFHVKDSIVVEGPAKFYYCNLAILHHQEQEKSQRNSIMRGSLAKASRFSSAKYDNTSILRRTLYNKD